MKLLETAVRLSRKHISNVPSPKKHFSFLFDKTQLVHFSWNDYYGTHPLAAKLNYGFAGIHSEVAVILPFRKDLSVLRGMTLVNVRLNAHGELRISKPCEICSMWVNTIAFKKVFYSTDEGSFLCL